MTDYEAKVSELVVSLKEALEDKANWRMDCVALSKEKEKLTERIRELENRCVELEFEKNAVIEHAERALQTRQAGKKDD